MSENGRISEMAVGQALRVLWNGKSVIGLFVGCFLFLALFGLAIVKPKHSAYVTLSPSNFEQSETNSLSGAIGGIAGVGALANLAGIEIGGQSPNSFILLRESLFSVDVAEGLIEETGILPMVFPDDWDQQKKQWRRPPTIGQKLKNLLFPILQRPAWVSPNPVALSEFLKNEILISDVGDGSLIRLEVRHNDPNVAEAIVSKLPLVADMRIKNRVLESIDSRVEYLETRLSETVLAEQREVEIELLSRQLTSRMIVVSSEMYAAQIVDGPVVSNGAVWPEIGPMLILSLALGLVVGSLIVFSFYANGNPLSSSRQLIKVLSGYLISGRMDGSD